MTRLENTILYILIRAKQKGKDNLSKFELFKYIYLLEVEAKRFLGKSFVDNLNFVRYKNGPISFDVYDAINTLKDIYIKITEEKKPDYPHARHSISLLKKCEIKGLEQSEKLFINSILETYLSMPIKKLKEIVYNTEPMKRMQAEEKRTRTALLQGHPIDLNCIPLDDDLVDLIVA